MIVVRAKYYHISGTSSVFRGFPSLTLDRLRREITRQRPTNNGSAACLIRSATSLRLATLSLGFASEDFEDQRGLGSVHDFGQRQATIATTPGPT